jgi:hypothetical protein
MTKKHPQNICNKMNTVNVIEQNFQLWKVVLCTILIKYLAVNGVKALSAKEVLRVQGALWVLGDVPGLVVKPRHHAVDSIAKLGQIEPLVHVASGHQQLRLARHFQMITLVFTDGPGDTLDDAANGRLRDTAA